MISQPLLTIAIPSIPDRFEKAIVLYNKLEKQRKERLVRPDEVEIIMFTDNRIRSIGKKRECCIQLAQGMYVTLLDDDDDVDDEYVYELWNAIAQTIRDRIFNTEEYNEYFQRDGENLPGVICFKSKITDKFGSYIADMDLTHKKNEQPKKDQCDRYQDIKRTPWHVCAWRADIAKSVPFADVGYGEDWHWVKQLIPLAGSQIKIDKVLHHYKDFPDQSAAPTHSNEIWNNPNENK